MILHIYNPEHDISLAHNARNYVISRAALLTRERYSHVPAYWATNDDWVLVGDPNRAQEALAREGKPYARVVFLTERELQERLRAGERPTAIAPWGWDRAIKSYICKQFPELTALVPSDEQLQTIRALSSRCFAAKKILPELVALDPRLIGVAEAITKLETLSEEAFMTEPKPLTISDQGYVLKSPWSCSGRGVRFVREGALTANDLNWARRVIAQQGCVMREPLYKNQLDFAMEFEMRRDACHFLGINVFATRNGAYEGNLNEEGARDSTRLGLVREKLFGEEILFGEELRTLLNLVRERLISLCSSLFRERYIGPFGVDMMIVSVATAEGQSVLRLHPCVELNLRRTMGHVNLALASPRN